ncbi:MAG: preprotein translocase subunit YajC [Lachnospiraceae bacterium]|nr:preprotein translocase subunit YajC [Lachnospiraceae bacterium]
MIRNWIAVLTQGTDASAGSTLIPFVIMLVVFAAVFYFMIYRPQANQEKKQKALLSSLAIGDSVLTTGGFYGVIIDMVEDQDIIIVEFGNNKNCRIPMKKAAVIEVERADAK